MGRGWEVRNEALSGGGLWAQLLTWPDARAGTLFSGLRLSPPKSPDSSPGKDESGAR